MTTARPKSRRRSTPTPVTGDGSPSRLSRVTRRMANLVRSATAVTATLIGHVPGTVRATRAGAQGTTAALQSLPDATLRWMAAGSVGLGAGLRLARAPRIVVAAGVVPALLAGAAIVSRPEPAMDPEKPPA
jgi:hypothetical protein